MKILYYGQVPPITKQIKLIDKKKFANIALNINMEVFIIHITFLLIITIYLARKTKIALLFAKKVKISVKYSDFSNMFLKKMILVLPKLIKLNQYVIKLQDSK